MPAFLAFMTAGIERLFLARRQEDEIDALRDHAVDVGDLLGGRAGCVGIDELVAALGGFVLHARGLREAPRVVALGLGEADLVMVLLLQRRNLPEGGMMAKAGGGADRPDKRLSTIDEHCVSSFAARFARSCDGALTGQLRAFQGERERARPSFETSPPEMIIFC